MDSDWETLAQCRTIAHLCALFKVYTGEEAWKAIHDRLWKAYYLSRVEQVDELAQHWKLLLQYRKSATKVLPLSLWVVWNAPFIKWLLTQLENWWSVSWGRRLWEYVQHVAALPPTAISTTTCAPGVALLPRSEPQIQDCKFHIHSL